MTLENELEALRLIKDQLEKAINIIANSGGDFIQELVYNALVDVGYYEEEYDDYEEKD
jgi:hypothetical protein